VFGVEIQAGTIKPKVPLITKDGQDIGEILQIQDKGKAVPEASVGMQVAISLEKPIVGRHINEGDTLYTKTPEAHAKALQTKFIERLTTQEQEALTEYIALMRKKTPFWAA
jgi:translation initiation factor 5B